MRFGGLGPVVAWTAAGQPVTIPGRKVRALLAVLLIHDGRPVSAHRLIDDLWDGQPPGKPTATLSAKVSQLRAAFDRAEPGAGRLVLSTPPGYALRIEDGDVDVHRFRTLVREARDCGEPDKSAALLLEALALWRGSAYADVAGLPYASAAAARLDEERLTAREDLAEARLAAGEGAELVAELGELVTGHPLRERLRAAHMRALQRAGRHQEALDSYRRFRTRLGDETGLDPSPALAAVHRDILTRDLPVGGRPRGNLPAITTALIGRDAAIAAVRDRLDGHRLVTLTGPGGVGKTRLALAAAAGLVDAYDDGVWLVELAGGGAGAPADAVRGALDVRDLRALRASGMLLVLDNCEHVVDAAAELAGRLLRDCAGLRIIATSRQPLGVAGEALVPVPPLDVPDGVALFAARARAAAPGFRLDAGNADAVAEICRRLDGMPLALELAATRVPGLGVQAIVERLDDRFRLLDRDRRGGPARQRTLTATIGWSWDLLTPDEQAVLRRVSVHAGGFTLASAEAVAAGGGDTAGVLSGLVDRSLVAVAAGGRFRLLESVGAYAAARLEEAGEADAVRARHRAYFVALAEEADRRLRGPDQRDWLARLDEESGNLDAAARDAEPAQAVRLASALTWYRYLRGRLAEAERALDAALAGGPDADAYALRAAIRVLRGGAADPDAATGARDPRTAWFLANAEIDLGDTADVERRARRTLDAFRATGDAWGAAAALGTLARVAHVRADLPALASAATESAALFRSVGDRRGQMNATGWLAAHAEIAGEYDRARRLETEGLRLAEELGLWPAVSEKLASLGWLAVRCGDPERARRLSGHALRLATECGHQAAEIFASLGLGFAAARLGDLDLAEAVLGDVLRAADPSALSVPLLLLELARIAALRGRTDAARAQRRRALDAADALDANLGRAMAFEGLAASASEGGDHRLALVLVGVADALRSANGMPRAPVERADIDVVVRSGRAAIGGVACEEALETGRGLTTKDTRALVAAQL